MKQLIKAKEILLSGGIVIYPTETVYGIGCLLSKPNAIKKLYKIKGRQQNQPTSVLVNNFETAESLVSFNKTAQRLANKFWPGSLTICLPALKSTPKGVLGGGSNLGVRVPANKWLLELLNDIKQPLLAPSANFRGQLPPKKFVEIDKELIKLVDYVVDNEPGGDQPSTVISFENSKEYKLIREGSIKRQQLDQVLSTR